MPPRPPFIDSQVPDSVRRPAPAKVNLGLHVLRRRPDGFHDVETVLAPLGWSDLLVARPSAQFIFTCSDQALPTDSGNLVVRAANLLATWTAAELDLAIHLEKRVPYGAGLGSGSSDAAATLMLLVDVLGLEVPLAELLDMAAGLGSDVPFFLQKAAALATGRGDVISTLNTALGRPYRMPFSLVVAVPPVFVSTAEAYDMVMPNDSDRPDLASLVLGNDLAEWRMHLVNDFEAPILAREPIIAQAKQSLLDGGAGYASLSGSGAAVFGVFEDSSDAQKAASTLQAGGCRVWVEPAASL